MNIHYQIRYVSYVLCSKKHMYFRQIKTYQEYYNCVVMITLFPTSAQLLCYGCDVLAGD
jgi:hypothetical protein